MAKVGMIGAGSWGIALAKLLYNNGNEVTVWSALLRCASSVVPGMAQFADIHISPSSFELWNHKL